MSFGRIHWSNWRWALRRPFQFDHIERHTANGIKWYARFAFWTLTRYQDCTCD